MTDPSGYIWCAVIGAIIGFLFGAFSQSQSTQMWKNMAVTFCEEYMRANGHKDWKWSK